MSVSIDRVALSLSAMDAFRHAYLSMMSNTAANNMTGASFVEAKSGAVVSVYICVHPGKDEASEFVEMLSSSVSAKWRDAKIRVVTDDQPK